MVNTSKLSSIFPVITISLGALLATTRLDAQEPQSKPAPDGLVLQEIVVTAQKRPEPLQDVPIAISAFSQDDVDKLHIDDIESLSRSVPSLSFSTGGGEAAASVRGVSTGYGLAPAVGLYIDEMPLDLRSDQYSGSTTIELFDMDHIEVLRGPQGTLFGASSMGGTIRLMTAQPDPTKVIARSEAEWATTDGGDPSYALRGALNLPINENLAVRAVAVHRHDGGFIEQSLPTDYSNITGNEEITKRNVNDTSIDSFRLALRWTSDSGWKLTPAFIYQATDARGASASSPRASDFEHPSLFTSKADYRIASGSFKIEKDFGAVSVVSATSYLNKKTKYLADISETGQFLVEAFGLPSQIPSLSLLVPVSYRQWTQELRLLSGNKSWIRWVVGGYFAATDQSNVNSGFSTDFIPLVGTSDIISYDAPTSDRQLAGFADVTITPISKLDVSVGARVYNFRQTIQITQGGLFGGENTPRTSAKKTGVNPKFTLTYRAMDGVNVYATAAKGFRAGGANPRIASVGNCTFEDVYSPSYDPDSVWNYEVGAKTSLLANRATVNVAAYQINWSNFQGQVSSNCGVFVGNIGSARTRGVEMEIHGRISDALQAQAGLGYTDAKIRKVDSAFATAGIGSPGQRIINVPKIQFSLGIDYEYKTESSGTWFFAPNWQHVGAMTTTYAGESPERPAYNNVNVTTGVRRGNFEVSTYVDNLTNDVQVTTASTGFYNAATFYVARPRTIGLKFRYDY